jgi:glycosyltransferase involved in cell wall biosynthesis
MQSNGRRLRVLQLTGALAFGGAEKVVSTLLTGVDPSRFEMSVCCIRGLGALGERLRAEGQDVFHLRRYEHRTRHLIPLHVFRLLRQRRPDLIHTHDLIALSAIAPLAFLGLLPPWIHTFHFGNYPYSNRNWMRLERHVGRRATRLVAVAGAQREALLRHHHFSPGQVTTILNGVQPNEFVDRAERRQAKRAEFGFSRDDCVVGTIAVLSRQKGVTFLLQAAQQVLRHQPAVKFLIVGSGPLEEALKGEAAALGLGSAIHFAGWRSDVAELITALDIYVMASLWEAMPLALLEAMAAERAIVVTDVGDNAQLVGQGECAVVVPAGDANSLSTAINGLVETPQRRYELGSRARARYQDHYTTRHMLSAYERVYEASS